MTVQQIIAALGGKDVVAKALGVDSNTVVYWERRRRIPTRRWSEIVRLAHERQVAGVTFETLHAMWSAEPIRGHDPQDAAA